MHLHNFCVIITVIIYTGGRDTAAQEWQAFQVPKYLPANMVSKLDAANNASLGFDGNTNDQYITGLQCVHTAVNEILPWWMLDMLQSYLINMVKLYRRSGSGSREVNLGIGVSSQQLAWTSFSLSLFDICYFNTQQPAASPAQNPLNFTCYRPIAGRYLTVYRNTSASSEKLLNFCEIDIFVYQRTTSMLMYLAEPIYVSAPQSAPPITLAIVGSQSECVVLCALSSECLYTLINYQSGGVTVCYQLRSFNVPATLAAGVGGSNRFWGTG